MTLYSHSEHGYFVKRKHSTLNSSAIKGNLNKLIKLQQPNYAEDFVCKRFPNVHSSHSESVHVKNTYLQIKCKYPWTFLYKYFRKFSWLFLFSCNYFFLFLLILSHAEYYISQKKRNEFKPVLLQAHAEFFSKLFLIVDLPTIYFYHFIHKDTGITVTSHNLRHKS